nr:NADH dehydrogenase subunit 2 [Eublepharis macularius]
MNPMILFILLFSLAMGTITTLSSYHWLLAWIGLEINTMAIIPIITKKHHPRATEAATKYFLTQTAASTLILLSSTLNAWTTGQWTITELHHPLAMMMLTLAVAMKLGLAPTHFWLPEVMQGTTIKTALLLTTWQKIAPLTFIYLTSNHLSTKMLFTLGLLSVMLGGITGLNQTQTRKIMAYSSIAHMGWLTMILTLNLNLMTFTLMLYITMTTSSFMILLMSESKTMTDLGLAWTTSPTSMLLLMLSLLSLGGLPPLSGFMPKLLILKEMTMLNMIAMSTILALSALPSLFFYLRLSYLMLMTIPPTTTTTEHKWRHKNNTLKITAQLFIITTTLLPITPLVNKIL